MTFLEMVKKLRRECSVVGAGPATVLNQTGELSRLVEWVKQAYEEVQSNYHDWLYLKVTSTFITVNGTETVSPPSDLNVWDINRFRIGDQELEGVEYNDQPHLANEVGQPTKVVINNDNTLTLIPTPDAAYTVTFDYFKVPGTVINDIDEFLIPNHLQRAILGRAMMYYGNYEQAEEVSRQGQEIYQIAYKQLENNQLWGKQQFAGRSASTFTIMAQ